MSPKRLEPSVQQFGGRGVSPLVPRRTSWSSRCDGGGAVDRDEPDRSAPDRLAEDRRRVDVEVAATDAEMEVGAGDGDEISSPDPVAHAGPDGRHERIRRAETVGMLDRDVQLPAHLTGERDDSGSHGSNELTRLGAVLEAAVARQPVVLGQPEWVGHRGVDRWSVLLLHLRPGSCGGVCGVGAGEDEHGEEHCDARAAGATDGHGPASDRWLRRGGGFGRRPIGVAPG